MADGIVPTIETVEGELRHALCGSDRKIQVVAARVSGIARAAINMLSPDLADLMTVKVLLDSICDDIDNLADDFTDLAARHDAAYSWPEDKATTRLMESSRNWREQMRAKEVA